MRERVSRHTDGFWYVPAVGSGIWLSTGATIASDAKANLSATLAKSFVERYREALPSPHLVTREPTTAGAFPLAFTARRLGLDSVQTVHLPSRTPEIVLCDARSLYESVAEHDLWCP